MNEKKMIKINAYIPISLYKDVKEIMEISNTSLSDMIRLGLRKEVNRLQNELLNAKSGYNKNIAKTHIKV